MDRWHGKIAVVTGASAGIGASIVEKLVENGVVVAGLARRIEKLEELCNKLLNKPGKIIPVKCDITKENEIIESFEWIKKNLGPVHILVNNAGVLRDGFVHCGKTEEWRLMFDTNVIGLCICTREAIQQMLKDKIDGHVIHINSIAGHKVTLHNPPSANVYPASKHAVTALTESLRQEMNYLKNKIKITSISPGLTSTEIFEIGNSPRFAGGKMNTLPHLLPEDISNAVIYVLGTPPHVQSISPGLTYTDMFHIGFPTENLPYLLPEDVANSVIYVLGTPPHVQVHELTIKPVGENV